MRTLVLLLVCSAALGGCSVSFPVPVTDGGAPAADAAPSGPSCLEWRLRENPEDLYCARWSADAGPTQ